MQAESITNAQPSLFMTLLPIVVTIILAVLAHLFTYFHKKKTDARANRLNKVNLQLKEFYGPLYAELLAGEAAWNAFYKNYWPSHWTSPNLIDTH